MEDGMIPLESLTLAQLGRRFKPDRLLEADGLRGVAMLFVFLYHFRYLWLGFVAPGSLENVFLQLVYVDGGIGTDFFMLLSGFFSYMTWNRGNSNSVSFIKRRLYRVYPLFFLVSLLYISTSLVYPSLSRLPSSAGAATVYVLQSLLFLPGVLRIPPLMSVAWTMSWVVLFYLLTPVISRTLDRLGLNSLQKSWTLAFAAILWMTVAQATGWMLPRTAMFLVGMSLSEAFTNRTMAGAKPLSWTVTCAWLCLSMAALAGRTVVMLDPVRVGIGRADLLAALATSVAVGSFVWSVLRGATGLRKTFAWTPLVWLGVVSYPFYLTHGMAIKFVRLAIPWDLGHTSASALVFWSFHALTLLLAVILAAVVFLLVENPVAHRLSRTRDSGETTARAADVSRPVLQN
jgi:exopolysaccharide production protein ExoZ